MDITIQFARPLKKEYFKNHSEAVGLSKDPPLKYFGDQVENCGSVRVAVTEARNRIVLSTD